MSEPSKEALDFVHNYDWPKVISPLDVAVALDRFRVEGVRDTAQWLEARACRIRDSGEWVNEEGILMAVAGAHMGALFDAARKLRTLTTTRRER